MKTWLKGGLIGLVINFCISIIGIILTLYSQLFSQGKTSGDIGYLLLIIPIGFLIGALIGLIIQKPKSKKSVPVRKVRG
jgi:hypothetical protein